MGLSQLARASTAMAFLNALLAMFIPAAHPSVDARAMNVEQVGDLGRGVCIGPQQKGLEPQRDTGGFVRPGLLAQGQELAASARVGLGKDWVHGNICRVTNARILRLGERNQQEKTRRRAPSDINKKPPRSRKAAQDRAILKLM